MSINKPESEVRKVGIDSDHGQITMTFEEGILDLFFAIRQDYDRNEPDSVGFAMSFYQGSARLTLEDGLVPDFDTVEDQVREFLKRNYFNDGGDCQKGLVTYLGELGYKLGQDNLGISVLTEQPES